MPQQIQIDVGSFFETAHPEAKQFLSSNAMKSINQGNIAFYLRRS